MNPADRELLMAAVEAFCQEIRPIEELCYLEYRFNDQVIPLAARDRLLGMLVPIEFGEREADAVSYSRALARIGQEGTGVRTLFSGKRHQAHSGHFTKNTAHCASTASWWLSVPTGNIAVCGS